MALNFQIFKPASLKQLLDDTDYVDGIITNTIYNDNYRLITGKDNLLNIRVNDKFLDFFDDPEVKVLDETKPVLIYERGELVGLVLPIRVY